MVYGRDFTLLLRIFYLCAYYIIQCAVATASIVLKIGYTVIVMIIFCPNRKPDQRYGFIF